MAYQYTQSQLLSDINTGIFGKIGMIPNTTDFINNVVREAHNDVTFKSTKITELLSPTLSPDVVEYTCPVGLRDYKIIDIAPGLGDSREYGAFHLVPQEEWNRSSQFGDFTIDDSNGDRTLLIQTRYSSSTDIISPITDTIVYITYYSIYPWQSASGVLKTLSTTSSDLLVAGESEYDLLVKKGIQKGRSLTRADQLDRVEAKTEYDDAVKAYKVTNIDESQMMISTYAYQQ
jgi:hypothetical protein